MDRVLETIFYPFEKNLLTPPAVGQAVAFFNAQYNPALREWGARLHLQQYFKPYVLQVQEEGFTVSSDIAGPENHYDYALVLLPKNITEARYLTAQALIKLKGGGILVCAADNKTGGGRIVKMLQEFGFKFCEESSKNKARVVWATKMKMNEDVVQQAIADGAAQKILDGAFVSTPGMFGWDKIDKGSEILARHLPTDLKGAGADFGCGYGYLAWHVLQHNKAVSAFSCIDADYRAVKACQDNLSSLASSRRKPGSSSVKLEDSILQRDDDVVLKFFWEDLTRPLPALHDLDFIVMNPPFHEGKETDSAIGRKFIETAAQALRPDGQLWMVANAQLPYEQTLQKNFKSFEKKFEGEGFKIFRAVK